MKHFVIAAAAFALSSTPAFAEDVDWSGVYLGAQAGYGWGHADQPYGSLNATTFPSSQNAADQSGAVGGLYAGYNMRSGSAVFGLEGDFNIDGIDGDDAQSGGDTNGVKHRWNANIRARAGMLVGDSTLVYAAGGVSFLNAKATNLDATPAEEIPTDWTGWTLGGGIEQAFGPKLKGRLEYRYADYGKSVANFTLSGYSEQIQPKISTVMVGVSYQF